MRVFIVLSGGVLGLSCFCISINITFSARLDCLVRI